jgi:dynein heavy chain
MKLRKSDTMNQKVIQLFETLLVRFGVMIVGPAGGGKTTIYKLLAESLSILN